MSSLSSVLQPKGKAPFISGEVVRRTRKYHVIQHGGRQIKVKSDTSIGVGSHVVLARDEEKGNHYIIGQEKMKNRRRIEITVNG